MIDFRNERPDDQKAIFHVTSCAFGQLDEAQLINQLREGGDIVISLVAEEDGEIVGHALLSRLNAPFPALALAPVSVIPTRQRRGIGLGLIKRAVDQARADDWAAIFVLGDPDYYERFGFSSREATGFTSPYAGRHFMILKLWPFLPATTGELRYPPAFGAVD